MVGWGSKWKTKKTGSQCSIKGYLNDAIKYFLENESSKLHIKILGKFFGIQLKSDQDS